MSSARSYASWLAVTIGCVSASAIAQAGNRTALTDMHLTVLTYDRNMGKRGDDTSVTLGVVFNPESAVSERDAKSIGGDFASSGLNIKLNKRQVNAVLVAWRGDNMKQELRAGKVDLLYLAADTWEQLDEIKSVAAQLKVPTMAGSQSMVSAGIALGVIAGDSGPQILINRKAARAQGMYLDARVYRHATLINE